MVLYFYSLLTLLDCGKTAHSSGTVEVSRALTSSDEFGELVDALCKKNNVDREKTVVTALNRL